MPDSLPRSRAWLYRYVRQELPRTPRVKRYLAHLVGAGHEPLLLDDPPAGPEQDTQAYNVSRGGANLIGRKAFLFRTPGTPWFGKPELLADVLRGLASFGEHQNEHGEFIWGRGAYGQWGAHEHCWRIEPLLMARIWLEDHLSRSTRQGIDAMLGRASARLLALAQDDPVRNLQYNNRGAVWCAISTMCGLYFRDQALLDEVAKQAPAIFDHVLDRQGQVAEATLQYCAGGPDANYSYTGWVYVQLYRVLSGVTAYDQRLLRALRWFALSNSRRGFPLAAGASLRIYKPAVALPDVIPALEFFSDREPYFSRIIDHWLDESDRSGGGHTIHPYIWASFAHQKVKPGPVPAWYADSETHYENKASQYSLITHRYQTALGYRGLYPFQGLQSFSYGAQPPLVQATADLASGTWLNRTLSAAVNVSAGAAGWEIFRRDGGPGDGYQPAHPATLVATRRGKLWELCVFTRESVVLIRGSESVSALRTQWVLGRLQQGEVALQARRRCLTMVDGPAELHYLGGRGRLEWLEPGVRQKPKHTKGASGAASSALALVVESGPIAAFGLGGPGLALETLDGRRRVLRFTDGSGRYELDFTKMLDAAGDLDLWNWHRLKKL